MSAPGTPGPWKVAHRGFGRVPCLVGRKDGKPVTVAGSFGTEADARTAAAAPKLFEALECAIRDLDATYQAAKTGRPIEISLGQFRRLAAMQDALRKARGEPND